MDLPIDDNELHIDTDVSSSELGLVGLGNSKKRTRFTGKTEIQKDEMRYKYLAIANKVKMGEYSYREAAKLFGLSRTTLNRIVNNKIQINDLGKLGRRSLLTHSQEAVFLQAISSASSKGGWVTKAEIGALALDTSNQVNKTTLTQIPTESYYYKLKKRHKQLAVNEKKIADRCDDKLCTLDRKIFEDFFNDVRSTFEQINFEDIRSDCGLGIPAVPSNAVYCCDEISLSMYKDTDQYAICIKNERPAGNLAGNIPFHITLMVTINLAGFLLPPFVIVSNNYSLAQEDRNLFIGLGQYGTITCNESGSMQASVGIEGEEGYIKGSFRSYCDYLVSMAHNYAALARDKTIIVYTDNHGSRNDPSALELLNQNNIRLKTIPRNTSFILQAGDTVHLNKKLQDARRCIISNLRKLQVKITPETVIKSIPSIISRIINTDIYLAAQTVGFHYDDSYRRLLMTSACISLSIKKFDHIFIFDDEKRKEINQKQDKIFHDIQLLKTQGIIPKNIDSSVCNPSFIFSVQKIASGEVKGAVNDMPRNSLSSHRKLNHRFNEMTTMSYISHRKKQILEKNAKSREIETKKRLRKELQQELVKRDIKLGAGPGGIIKSTSGFIKQYYDEEISIVETISRICAIRGVKASDKDNTLTI